MGSLNTAGFTVMCNVMYGVENIFTAYLQISSMLGDKSYNILD